MFSLYISLQTTVSVAVYSILLGGPGGTGQPLSLGGGGWLEMKEYKLYNIHVYVNKKHVIILKT